MSQTQPPRDREPEDGESDAGSAGEIERRAEEIVKGEVETISFEEYNKSRED